MSLTRNCTVFLCLILAVGVCSCNTQKKQNNALILKNYGNDSLYNFNLVSYFIPLPIHQDFLRIYRSFDPSKEYDESMLKTFSSDYIRSNIHELYSIWLNSKKIPCVIQFPNRNVFDKHLTELQKNSVVTGDSLKKLLKFEYRVDIIEEGIQVSSDNYVSIDEYALYNGEGRYWLSDEYYSYLLSDDFDRNMKVFRTWVTQKKWNDLNSTISRKDWYVYVYTFNPENNLPVINDIDKVTLLDSETNTYMTKTGSYVFDCMYADSIETFENSDGSLDILYVENNGKKRGIRIYTSGATTAIDSFRRVIPQ